MGSISFTPIQDGTSADASDVNPALSTIYDEFNGNIEADNLANSAVTTAKVSDSAITGEKLGTPVAFRAYRSASQNSTATPSVLLCDTEVYDLGSNLDITTNQGRFTAPYDGIYNFSGRFRVTTGAASAFARCLLYVNGSENTVGNITRTNAAESTAAVIAADIQLTAGDYVELYINSTATYAITSSPSENYFCGHLVGRT